MMNQIQIEYPNAINVTFFNNFKNDKVVGFEDIYLNNKGLINHMNNKGNKTIYNKIKNLING